MSAPSAPPAAARYHRKLQFGLFLRQLWRSRALVRTLTERELRARYKQAMLGFAWAFVGPVGWVAVFSVFFNRVSKIATNGVPYTLFSYTAVVPWGFFSAGVGIGATGVLSNIVLVNKVACPREVFVLGAVVTAFVDAAISALVLPVLFLANGFEPKMTSVFVPLVLVVQTALVVGVSLLLGSVLMYVRDVRHVLPLLLQLGLFATPVAWGLSSVPGQYRSLYALLNPMAPLIDSYRRVLLFGQAPDWGLFGLGTFTSFAVLVGGYALFKRLEPGFADVA